MKLSELKTGERGVIVKVTGHGSFRKRIIELGFISGKVVSVVRNAPLSDPVEYEIMGAEIAIHRNEAAMIEVVGEHETSSEKNVQSPIDEYRQLSVCELLLHRHRAHHADAQQHLYNSALPDGHEHPRHIHHDRGA